MLHGVVAVRVVCLIAPLPLVDELAVLVLGFVHVPSELLVGCLGHLPLVLGHMRHSLQFLVDFSSQAGLLQVVF